MPTSLNLVNPPFRTLTLNTDELNTYCLFEKIWGESLPLSTIIHRTHNDKKIIRGKVDYVDLGNEWILLRFANSQDKLLVHD